MTSTARVARLFVSASVLAVGLASQRAAHAYRPFDGTDADVASAGEFELEAGPIGYLREGSSRFVTAPTLVANYGIVPRVELVFQGRGLYLLDAAPPAPRVRFVDTGFFVKTVLREGSLQDGVGPSLALEIGPLLPTWHDDTRFGGSAALIVSQRTHLGTIHVNLQSGRSRAGRLEGFWSVILEGPDRWTVRPVGEVFYDREVGEAATTSLLGGAIWRLSEAFTLDGALRWARRADVTATELRAGFTWAFDCLP